MAMREFKHPEKSILGRIERLEADVEGETKIFFDKESRNRVFDKISLLREVEAGLGERLRKLKKSREKFSVSQIGYDTLSEGIKQLRAVLEGEGEGG